MLLDVFNALLGFTYQWFNIIIIAFRKVIDVLVMQISGKQLKDFLRLQYYYILMF